jgi:hypothetical protein
MNNDGTWLKSERLGWPRQQTNVGQALKNLRPENLVAEAEHVKQAKAEFPTPFTAETPADERKSVANAQAVLIAAFHGHTRLETAFYQDAIKQSNLSFIVALGASIIALVFFLIAIVISALQNSNAATISAIGGAIAGLIAGVNFYLYGMTSTQFDTLQARLDRLQRFSLAEYMCELLGTEKTTDETVRDKALAAVIANLASCSLAESPTYITPLASPSVDGAQKDHGENKVEPGPAAQQEAETEQTPATSATSDVKSKRTSQEGAVQEGHQHPK